MIEQTMRIYMLDSVKRKSHWRQAGIKTGLILVLFSSLGLAACGDATSTATPATTAPISTTAPAPATTVRATTAVVTTASASTTAVTTAAAPTVAATSSVSTITAITTIAATTPASTTAAVENPNIKRDSLTVDLGDFQTKAELSYPANGAGPFPTVVIIAGTGPYDLDGSIVGFDGKVSSQLFKTISDALNLQGFAVMRYNKHYVTGPADSQAYQLYNSEKTPTLQQLQADADKVYAAAKANNKVDPNRLIIYGWSEGTTIATQLALAHSEVAGLILHAPPSSAWKDLFAYQEGIVLDFMRGLDSDKDGQLTLAELQQAFQKGVGAQVSLYLFGLTYDRTSSVAAPKLSTITDKNGDGKLDLEKEVKPTLDQYVNSLVSGNSIYSPEKQLPAITEAITKFNKPVLILQGENDANVSPEDAKKIDAALTKAGNPDHKMIIYPGLGHTLGKSSSPATDRFASIEPQPVQDITAWLSQHYIKK